jgi:general stress protein 26
MHVPNFETIETEFIQRVHAMVWCAVASIDTQNRPRTRILHPIWEGATGWIGTDPRSLKAKHLAHNPHLSLAYISNIMNPVYVECTAEWIEDRGEKQRIWDLFKTAPEPLGYDPAITFVSVDHESFGLLKLTPWRIDLVSFPSPSMDEGTKVWQPAKN